MNTIIANGIELAYTDNGTGNPIIVLHGNSGSHEEMNLIELELSKTHRVISFDLRGHGQSDPGSATYSIKLLALDIISACDNLGIINCDMIGYSDGGNIVLTINILKPKFVSRSILIAPNYSVSGMTMKWVIILNIQYMISSIGNLFKKTYGGFNSKLRLMVRDYKLRTHELHSIKSKTLILEAEYDMIKHKHLLELNEKIASSRLSIINDSTHFSIIHSPQTVEEIKEFLTTD